MEHSKNGNIIPVIQEMKISLYHGISRLLVKMQHADRPNIGKIQLSEALTADQHHTARERPLLG